MFNKYHFIIDKWYIKCSIIICHAFSCSCYHMLNISEYHIKCGLDSWIFKRVSQQNLWVPRAEKWQKPERVAVLGMISCIHKCVHTSIIILLVIGMKLILVKLLEHHNLRINMQAFFHTSIYYLMLMYYIYIPSYINYI